MAKLVPKVSEQRGEREDYAGRSLQTTPPPACTALADHTPEAYRQHRSREESEGPQPLLSPLAE